MNEAGNYLRDWHGQLKPSPLRRSPSHSAGSLIVSLDWQDCRVLCGGGEYRIYSSRALYELHSLYRSRGSSNSFVYSLPSVGQEKPFFKLFMLCAATMVIAGFSHSGDRLFALVGQLPSMTSPLRPHNLWHTPTFGLLLSALAALLIPRLLNSVRRGIAKVRKIEWARFNPRFVPLLAATYLGYLIHVFADSITYDFDVWWGFPFSRVHFSLYDLAHSGKLLAADPANPWGWWYYYLTPALIVIAMVFVGLFYLARK